MCSAIVWIILLSLCAGKKVAWESYVRCANLQVHMCVNSLSLAYRPFITCIGDIIYLESSASKQGPCSIQRLSRPLGQLSCAVIVFYSLEPNPSSKVRNDSRRNIQMGQSNKTVVETTTIHRHGGIDTWMTGRKFVTKPVIDGTMHHGDDIFTSRQRNRKTIVLN